MRKDRVLEGGYSHSFISGTNICHVKGTGVVNSEMTKIAMDNVAIDPQFSKNMQLLVDLRELNYHPSYQELMHLKDHLNFLKEYFQSEVAVVTSGALYYIAYLVSQMSLLKMKAFKDCEQAREWLEDCSEKRPS